MWVSQRLGSESEGFSMKRGRVTIAGESPAVDADGERRDAIVLTPAGMTVLPDTGVDAVVCEVDGDCLLVGCDRGGARSVTLEARGATVDLGEDGVRIAFGEAEVALGADEAKLRFGSHWFIVTAAGVSWI